MCVCVCVFTPHIHTYISIYICMYVYIYRLICFKKVHTGNNSNPKQQDLFFSVENPGFQHPPYVYLLAQISTYVTSPLLIDHLLGLALVSPARFVQYLVLTLLAMLANSSASKKGKGPWCIYYNFPLDVKCSRISKSDTAEQVAFVMGYIKKEITK